MTELGTARKVLGIAGEVCRGVDTTRNEILEMAGRARVKELRRDLNNRARSGFLFTLPEKERNLQLDIISSLDQMSRRMPQPLPEPEIDRVEKLINELDRIRTSRQRLPVSPGLCIWRGELQLRRHDYPEASRSFAEATNILERMTNDNHDVLPTLVTALTEQAYSLAMTSDEENACVASDRAIEIARRCRGEEQFWTKIFRGSFAAGNLVTRPLAAAYFTACDIRINNPDSEWNPNGKLASDFMVYWNLLNDECGGLSALQIPHLIAMLSDENWMAKKPGLSAPIARSLYEKTADNIPHLLWRKANLFYGGFRYSDTLTNVAQSSAKAAAILIVLALVGFSGPAGLASSLDDVKNLSPIAIASYFDADTERLPIDRVPSGAEVMQSLQETGGQRDDPVEMAEELQKEFTRESDLAGSQDHATAGSSLVSSKLV